MRTVRTGLGAAAAVVALTACGSGPVAGPAPTVSTAYASLSPSTKAPGNDELSPANLASELLGRLAAERTFRAVTRTRKAGQDATVVTADLRATGDHAGLVATGDGRKVVKVGRTIYLKDAALTESNSRPWSELADANRSAEQLLWAAQVHELIGGAAHATTFQRADRITVDGKSAQEYVVTIDLPRATAADALGGFLTGAGTRTLPEALTLRIAVNARNLPVQLRFTLDDRATGSAEVVAVFSRFGQKLTIGAPPEEKIGTSRAN